MKAMVLDKAGGKLLLREVEKPAYNHNQLLIKVHCCGVCRTDLHILDGELAHPKLPLIPGHQIVGNVAGIGRNVTGFEIGEKVGVPWLGETCGNCEFCREGKENLCDNARFTGYDIDGGYAEFTVANAQYCFKIPKHYPDIQAAPLLCAGLIGYRSLRKTENAQNLGFYGYGSAAHILTQVAGFQNKKVYAFTRPGDLKGQSFAKERGAFWAGGSDEMPPIQLDAAIIFAPAGHLVPQALKAVKKGGKVVCAGIHMSNIPEFSYDILWEERSLESVANLTRRDGDEFLTMAPGIPVESNITTYPLEQANKALDDLRQGKFEGSAVLKVS